jgi:predicted PolB exonuclease-like 3'-5' exonuclease
MAVLVFDCETGPLPEDQLRLLMPEFDASKVKHPGEFDPSTVKYGNTKDEAKRTAILEEAKKKHADAVAGYDAAVAEARQQHERDFIDKAALSATTGRLVAIGLYRPDNKQSSIIDCADEAKVLAAFWQKYRQCRESGCHLVGFNIFGFDLPFLMQRSWIHQIDVPATLINNNRYFDQIFVDLMQTWACGRYGCYSSLDMVARALGIGGKNGDGAEFAKLWETDRNAAVAYLTNDLTMTAGIAARMGFI